MNDNKAKEIACLRSEAEQLLLSLAQTDQACERLSEVDARLSDQAIDSSKLRNLNRQIRLWLEALDARRWRCRYRLLAYRKTDDVTHYRKEKSSY